MRPATCLILTSLLLLGACAAGPGGVPRPAAYPAEAGWTAARVDRVVPAAEVPPRLAGRCAHSSLGASPGTPAASTTATTTAATAATDRVALVRQRGRRAVHWYVLPLAAGQAPASGDVVWLRPVRCEVAGAQPG